MAIFKKWKNEVFKYFQICPPGPPPKKACEMLSLELTRQSVNTMSG